MWSKLLEFLWKEQDKISALAKRIEDDSKKRISEIMVDASMYRDGLRASYQRLQDLEKQVREAANGEKLPEKKDAQTPAVKSAGVGSHAPGAKG